MSDCRICAASNEGAHVLKLEGECLTMCTAISIFSRCLPSEFVSVWVDEAEADGLDTTLGMLAQLAIQTQERFTFGPRFLATTPASIACWTPWVLISSLSVATRPRIPAPVLPRSAVACEEGEVKNRCWRWHRTLMAMNDENADAFKDLVNTLERP